MQVSMEICRRSYELCCRRLVEVVWALAVPKLNDRVSSCAFVPLNRLGDLDAALLSRSVWAMAMLRVGEVSFAHAFAARVPCRHAELTARDLANIAWAYAAVFVCLCTHGFHDLFNALTPVALLKMQEFRPQHIACLAWSFSTTTRFNPPFTTVLFSRMLARVQEFSSPDLAMTCWAYAVWSESGSVACLAPRPDFQLHQFSSQDISNISWALASRSVAEMPLLTVLSQEACQRLPQLTLQHLCNISWALAIAL